MEQACVVVRVVVRRNPPAENGVLRVGPDPRDGALGFDETGRRPVGVCEGPLTVGVIPLSGSRPKAG